MDVNVKELAEAVFDEVGPGYSEAVYHNAMEVLLRAQGVPYETERVVPIVFRNQAIGHVRCDIIMDNSIVLEFKSVAKLRPCDTQQIKNYIKLLGLKGGHLINFGPSGVEIIQVYSKDGAESV